MKKKKKIKLLLSSLMCVCVSSTLTGLHEIRVFTKFKRAIRLHYAVGPSENYQIKVF